MRYKNLWAPWRMEYMKKFADGSRGEDECFLCRYFSQPQRDAENLVLWRTQRSLVALNRYPYTNGHLLVCPAAHVAELGELTTEQLLELICLVRDAQSVLKEVQKPDGFNIGMNFGRCAGAGLPGHLHVHVVPRWEGDTNFMPVLAGARVIPQDLSELRGQLLEASKRLKLPAVSQVPKSTP